MKYLKSYNIFESEVIDIKNFNFHGEDDLLKSFKMLYELEYKYHKISESNLTKERHKNILNIIIEKSEDLILTLSDTFIDVYNEWISLHDIDNPEETGKKRLEYCSEGEMLDVILRDYNRFLYDINNPNNDRKRSTKNELERNINMSPENYPNVVSCLSGNEYYNEDDEIEEYTDVIFDSYQLDELPKYCYHEIYGQFVLPTMADRYGIEEILYDNKEIISDLKNITRQPLNKQFVTISIAINGIHAGGSMMDYYDSAHGLSKTDFDNLTDMDVSEWDKELKLLGF